MFARVITVTFQDGKAEEGASLLREGMVKIARHERGWQGLLLLTDPDSNRGLVVSLWERKADMLEPGESYRAQAVKFETTLANPATRDIYEVKVQEYIWKS
jgi:heme-degrading monooxygenase HmoA